MSGKVYSATYIGGHPDFKKKENVRIYLTHNELKIAPLAIKIKYSDIKETEITKVGFEKFLKIKCSIDSSIYELFFSDVSNIDELNNELKKLREKPLIIEEIEKPKIEIEKLKKEEIIWEKIGKSKTSIILVSIIVGMLIVLAVSLPYIMNLSRQQQFLPSPMTSLTETSETESKIKITVTAPTIYHGTFTEPTTYIQPIEPAKTVQVQIYRTVVNGSTIITYTQVTMKPSSIEIISPTIAEIGGFRVAVKDMRIEPVLDGYKYPSKYFAIFEIFVTNLNSYPKLFGVIGEYFGKQGSIEIAVLDWWNNKYYSFDKVPLPNSTMKWDVLPQEIEAGETKLLTLAFSVPIECTELRVAFRSAFDEEWGELPTVYKAVFEW
ncbi:MAG: hypothetical protein QXI58_01595 [Candidatus Micrarchaeia archaeon]